MRRLLITITFLLSVIFISCEKEPILTLSKSEISAPANGNTTTLIVNTNNPWTVSGNDWCTVSPSSGESGEISVTVTVKENTTYDTRNCSLTFNSKGLTASVSVNQDSNYGIVLPNNKYELSSDEQQISVEVKANVDYEVNIDADWIKQSESKALTSKTFTFNIEANNTYDDREGTITIKEKKGNNSEIIKVKQVQKNAIIISQKDYELSSESHTLEVKLQTNIDLDIIIPDNAKDWVTHTATKALSDKTLVFEIKTNEQYDARNCEVIIKQKSGELADTIKISQAQKDAIIISQKDYELSSGEHTLEIKLQTNVDIEIIVPENGKQWISYIETKALTDKIIILDIKSNETYDNRESEVYIRNKTTSLQDTIKIKQAQKDAIIILQDTYEIKPIGETINVEILANVDFEVIMPNVDWVSHVETKSLQSKNLQIKIKDNRGETRRNEIIIIKNQDKQLCDTLTIVQGFIPYLTFSAKTKQNLTMTKAVETLEYSLNGSEWSELGLNTIHFGGILGDIKLRGKSLIGTATGTSQGQFSTIVFGSEAEVECKGDIRTLVDFEDHINANTSEARFYQLFSYCDNLITPPELPSLTLAPRCYQEMFFCCINLLKAPNLPATNLASYCYYRMFYGCENLSVAPELPATTLASYCYGYMFYNTNLTKTPILPATILDRYSYAGMFMKCSNLKEITMLAMDINAQGCLNGWVNEVAPIGTFTKIAAMQILPSGPNGIPYNWSVINYVSE